MSSRLGVTLSAGVSVDVAIYGHAMTRSNRQRMLKNGYVHGAAAQKKTGFQDDVVFLLNCDLRKWQQKCVLNVL